ncbi:MAG: hypothetical protein ACI4E5_06555 [Suilimivivens sp.]
MKKGNKLIAKLLCFALVALTVLGYGSLKAEAQGENTTFTITIDDQSNIEGNKVEYQGNSTGEWQDVTSGTPIDISEMTSITIKATKAERVNVNCIGGTGFAAEDDVNGVTGDVGQRFELADGTSYGLEIKFTAQGSATPSENAGLKIDIANQNSANGTVFYQFFKDDESVGEPIGASSSTTISFPAGITKMNIKVVPGTNCQVGNYDVKLDGATVSDASKDDAKSESGNVITVSEPTKEYQVQVEFTEDGGGTTSPVEHAVTATISLSGDKLNSIEGVRVDGRDFQRSADKASATGDVDSTKDSYQIGFCVSFGEALNSVSINGVAQEIPQENEGWYYFTVPKTENQNYTISFTIGASDDVTIVWAYSEQEAQEKFNDPAAFVDHAKVQIVSVTRNGEPVSISYDPDAMSTMVALKKGDDIVVKLIPDYGYQLKSAVINDQQLVPDDNTVSQFSLYNIQGNMHFGGAFKEASDIINDSSNVISDVTIANGNNAASSGNLSLTLTDNVSYTRDVTSVVADATKVGSVDITLDNVVSKGIDGQNWTRNISEFENDITLGVKVDGNNLGANETYSIVRDHNGTLTELNATFNAATGVLSFPTNQFSTYTIIKKQGTPQYNPKAEKKEEKKEEIKVETKVETVVQKEASITPANKVQLPGGEKAVSSIGGVYNVESVEGVAVVTQKKDVYSAVGLSNEEVKAGTNVVLYMSDCLNKKTNQALNDVAVAANKKVVAYLTADMYTITKKGVINKVRQTGAPVELLIGVPQSARSANRQFSVVCIDPSKNVVTYNDMDTNPNTITVRANVFGNYAVVY